MANETTGLIAEARRLAEALELESGARNARLVRELADHLEACKALDAVKVYQGCQPAVNYAHALATALNDGDLSRDLWPMEAEALERLNEALPAALEALRVFPEKPATTD